MPLLRAPAKVNLTLEVLARRADGYHGVRSIMVPIGIFDRILIDASSTASFSCDDPDLAEDNIVTAALERARCNPLRVRVEKVIPTNAGLGGGSSDAAAILRAAMDGTIAGCARTDWLSTARELGSDVPFFLVGTAALVEGAGERVTALGAMPGWWTVVVQPGVRVATRAAYELLDASRSGARSTRVRSQSVSVQCGAALQRGDFGTVQQLLHNDFEDVVLAAFPAIEAARRALSHAAGRRAMLCGSGSCVFALFQDEVEARSAATRLPRDTARRTFVAPLDLDAAWRR